MKFINNTSDSIYLSLGIYFTPSDSNAISNILNYTIEAGKKIDVFNFYSGANYVVFRAYKGTSSNGNCLMPFINGVATEGKANYTSAMQNPTVIDTVRTITVEFNSNSREVTNSTRWGIRTTAIPNIVGKSYQLNSSIIGYTTPKLVANLTGTIKSSVLEHEFNLTEPRLKIDMNFLEFVVAEQLSTYFPSFFIHSSHGGYWRIVTGYNAGYQFSETEPPIITITDGDEKVFYSMYEWLEANATQVIDEEPEEETTEIPNLITLAGITVKPKGFLLQEVNGILPDNPYSLNIEVNGIAYNTFSFIEDAIYLSNDNGDSLEILNTDYELKIVGGADATNPNMINFIRINFTAVSEINGATITYKGVEKVVQTGLNVALKYANKKITDDIVIAFTENGVITYKGVETEVQAGQTATLKCKDKVKGDKMTEDLYVAVVEKSIEDDSIIGTWTVNETVSSFEEKVRINCTGKYNYLENAVGNPCYERSIGYIGYPNTSYTRNYFAVANGSSGIAFIDTGVYTTSDYFYSMAYKNRAEHPSKVSTFTIESVDADAKSEEYQIILAWLKANATKVS